ncbi:MAG: hypothetical protein JNL60_12395 [Bacteroidia bacterium]|nr:hypothetical protein [Bacteroidia bacterium]
MFESVLAQDIEQSVSEAKNLFKQEPISCTGSIGANAVFYKPYGIQARRDPFYWVLNANLNISLFNKINVPFTAVITQQDKNYSNGLDKFSQPFNQFGISPRYRWLTIHAGFRSLEFSEYTLSGAIFLGGGVEVKPEKSLISGTALYGRFVKAVPKGGVDGVTVSLPAYERWGAGTKLKVGTEQNYGEFIFLKMKDRVSSIAFDTALTITPQENQIIAIVTRQRVNSWLGVNGDFSYSMFTKNLYDDVTKIERFTYVNQIYSPRPSSQFNKAMNFGIDFNPGKARFGVKYKRIDPDYRSLGAIFLANDVEELSANSNFAVLKNRISVGVAAGLQRNNLDRIQVVTSQRFIGALNLSYNITESFNLSANYSNFSSNTLPVRDVFTDSIKFVQLTQNGSLSGMYAFGKGKVKYSLSNSLAYQESGGNKQALSTFLNETCSFNTNFSELGLGINISAIYNKSTAGNIGSTEGYGPNIGLQKGLYKNKIRLVVSSGFQKALFNKEALSRNISLSFGFAFTIDKHQSFKADCSYLSKTALKEGTQEFKEVRGGLGYVYNFGIKSKKIRTSKV